MPDTEVDLFVEIRAVSAKPVSHCEMKRVVISLVLWFGLGMRRDLDKVIFFSHAVP